MRRTVTLFVFSLLSYFISTAQPVQFPDGFQASQLATGLNPTDLAFSPDGVFLFVTEKSGKVFVVHDDEWHDEPAIDITDLVDPSNERGLGHVCVDPQFNSNGYVYLYYTTLSGSNNRIARFTFNFTTHELDRNSLYVVLDLPMLNATIHNGGAMVFGADGKLYVTAGENSQPTFAQDPTKLLGKVLRLNKDGSIPTDNPFYNTYTGTSRYIYALGLRNPFTAAIQPGTGLFYVNDVGQSSYEEINDIQAGMNYGWALVEGPLQGGTTPPANYQDPIYAYTHADGCAVIGAAFYNPTTPTFPASYQGKYFFGDYCNRIIKVLDPATHTVSSTFATGIGRPVAFAVRADGSFYFLDRGDAGTGDLADNTASNQGILWKVDYTGVLSPTLAAQPQSVTVSVGANVTFSLVANGNNLSYQWKKNGIDISGATSNSISLTNVQLADSGAAYTCLITNPHGNITSNPAVLRVTTRPAPVPSISMPLSSYLYKAGDTIHFAGGASDAVEGSVPDSGLTWKVNFHHDTHYHPVLEPFSDTSGGSFYVSPIIEVSDNVWYRIHLTATNDVGLSTSTYLDIFPQKVTLSFETEPAGIPLVVDGTHTNTPGNILSVVGVIRNIAAQSEYLIGDTLYRFDHWEDGSTDINHEIPTPETDSTITAHYTVASVYNGTGLHGEYFSNNITAAGTPDLTRTDANIDFDWVAGSPDPAISINQFSARWTGQIMPKITGSHTFYLNVDDGVRLYVNNQLIIDNFVDHNGEITSTPITLTAGVKYDIVLEYFEGYGNANIQMSWSASGLAKEMVPVGTLFEASSLPVVFQSFSLVAGNAYFDLFWSAHESGQVSHYVVERRAADAGGAFEQVATIPAKGGGLQSYTYRDETANPNLRYEYRVVEKDADGRAWYSAIRTGILSARLALDVVVIPNPAQPSNIIKVIFNQATDASLTLVSSAGKEVWRGSVSGNNGNRIVSIPGGRMASGIYYLKIVSANKIITRKIMIR